jgi:hypothetical protein
MAASSAAVGAIENDQTDLRCHRIGRRNFYHADHEPSLLPEKIGRLTAMVTAR